MGDTFFYDNKIHLKDCLKGMKNLPNDSADIVIIDPPYNIKKNFGNNSDDMPMGEYVKWCGEWIEECLRILKPNGIAYIYGFSEILARISCLIDVDKQRWLIWYYKNKTVPASKFWQRSHESIISFWKNKPIFNTDEVRVPYSETFLKNAAGKIRRSKPCRYSKEYSETIYTANENGALPRDVIEISTLAGGKGGSERFFYCKTCNKFCSPKEKTTHLSHKIIQHPTQKPLELTEKLIKAAKPKGEFNVLIPFSGSGSECVVCKKMRGNYTAFEINKDYVKLANEWLKTK